MFKTRSPVIRDRTCSLFSTQPTYNNITFQPDWMSKQLQGKIRRLKQMLFYSPASSNLHSSLVIPFYLVDCCFVFDLFCLMPDCCVHLTPKQLSCYHHSTFPTVVGWLLNDDDVVCSAPLPGSPFVPSKVDCCCRPITIMLGQLLVCTYMQAESWWSTIQLNHSAMSLP